MLVQRHDCCPVTVSWWSNIKYFYDYRNMLIYHESLKLTQNFLKPPSISKEISYSGGRNFDQEVKF